ncbi:MAG: hypothetical protein MRZ89_03360 [Lachnospiraceae bacterium]|nr:hypothetical protein [Lachnospiraceae bacterium]
MINMIEEFRGEYNGMHIAVVLRELGYRCGYVGVKKTDENLKILDRVNELEVHGGVTFTSVGNEYPIRTSRELIWIGFDCAHHLDGMDYDAALKLATDKQDIMFLNTLREESTGLHAWSVVEVICECCKLADEIITELK